MSIFSDEEENELINFENLKILDLFEDHSDIEAAECFDINSDKKKIISIKMDNSEKTNDDKSKKISAKSKSKKSEVREEEIHELKYNLYLGLFRDCLPAINDYKKIINKRNLKGQSLIIQLVEILEDQQVFHQKNYFFMPPGPEKELFFEIEENKFLKVSKGENVNMELCMKVDKDFKKIKDLKKFDEKTGPDIINKITIKKNDKSSKNKESPPESGTTQNSQNISLNKNQPSNINIINLDKKSEVIQKLELIQIKIILKIPRKLVNLNYLNQIDPLKMNQNEVYYSLRKQKKELNIRNIPSQIHSKKKSTGYIAIIRV